MLHPDLPVGPEGDGELLGAAHQAVFLLRHRLRRQLDRQTAREPDPLGIAPGLPRPAPDVVEPGGQLARRHPHEVRKPGVAVARGAPLGARPLAADPDGDARLLQRLRRKAHLAEAIVPAFEARLLVSPEPAQDLELLIGDGPALLEVGPQRVELLDHPSYAHPQDQPPRERWSIVVAILAQCSGWR